MSKSLKSFETSNEQTITSREIAKISGKTHFHVMEAIRKMEGAWEKIGGSKFRLTSYTDKSNRQSSQYELTKTESLYVATKFNDEARAKLVLRWEELEKATAKTPEMMLLESMKYLTEKVEEQQKKLLEAKPKVKYHDQVLISEDTYRTTQVAKELNMSGQALNSLLHKLGVQFRVNNQWVLYAKYQDRGYIDTVTTLYTRRDGTAGTNILTVWTEKGRKFVHQQVNKHYK